MLVPPIAPTLGPVVMPDENMLDHLIYDRPEPTLNVQLDRIQKFLEAFQAQVFQRLDKLEASLQTRRQETPRISQAHTASACLPRRPLADVNGQYQLTAAMDAKGQGIIASPSINGPVHLGLELAKVLYTEEEMASSTLTGRKVNGQCRQMLDLGRLNLIDQLVQRRFSLGEAEFAGIRSGIRDSMANRCKYLRLKLAPRNISVI